MTDLVHAMPGMKMVIIIPRDLNQSPGKMASQAAHAALIAGLKAQTFEGFTSWLLGGMKKIVLETPYQTDLRGFQGLANLNGIPCHLVQDEGFTEVEFGSSTALAIGPANETILNNITLGLNLYGYTEKKSALQAVGLLPTVTLTPVKPKRKRIRGKKK